MGGAFQAGVEFLRGVADAGDAVIDAAEDVAEFVELLLVVENHTIQALDVLLEMGGEDFQFDDSRL